MDIFKNFKSVIKIREVLVDDHVFQLHYRVTALFLLGCAALVASKQHFGDPIDCITRDDVPNKIMDTYCWIHSTFTMPHACNKTVGYQVPHPCVDKSSYDFEERTYHKYYQWVYFVLFFQAMLFYAPHFLWKSWESKLLDKLTTDLRSPLYMDEEKGGTIAFIVNYLYRNRGQHGGYYYRYTLCELMNVVNVVMQIYLVDEFLGGTFTSYGIEVWNYAQLEQSYRVDPMVRIFPRMTKCGFHRYGPSGDVQKYDALCILPLNIINEKIYIIMWFWFIFLAIVTSVWIVFRLFTYTDGELRIKLLARRARLVDRNKLEYVVCRIEAGHWFLLYMMCKNMDAHLFLDLIDQYYKKLRQRRVIPPSRHVGDEGSAKQPIIEERDTSDEEPEVEMQESPSMARNRSSSASSSIAKDDVPEVVVARNR